MQNKRIIGCWILLSVAGCAWSSAAEIVSLTGTLAGTTKLFRGSAFDGKATVTNAGQTPCAGGLYVRFTARNGFLKIIDSRFSLPAGETKTYDIALPGFNFEEGEGGTLELIYRELPDKDTVLAKQYLYVYSYPALKPGQNFLANGSFELGKKYGGTMLGYLDAHMMSSGWEGARSWIPLPTDGWWLDEGKLEQITFPQGGNSGEKCLHLDADTAPVSVISSLGRYAPGGMYTLSAYVRTKGAKGSIVLNFVKDLRQAKDGQMERQAVLDLPSDAKDWTRVTLKLESPEILQPYVRIQLTSGSVDVDDVQLELGEEASVFNVRPAEYLRISFDGIEDADMPKWVNTDDALHTLRVHNDSRVPLNGKITVSFGPWNAPSQQMLSTFDAIGVAPGTAKAFEFRTHGFNVDGYAAAVHLQDKDVTVVDGLWDFDPYAYTPYGIMNMLHSRSAARFAVLPSIDPRSIFGIANTTMEKTGALDPKSYIELHLALRKVGMSCIRGGSHDEEAFFLAVAGGLPLYAQNEIDNAPDYYTGPKNPCRPSRIDVYSKEGRDYLQSEGEKYGKHLAANPLVVGVQLANEQYWVNGGVPCPTKSADDNFRVWCQKRYGSLEKVNELWGTSYTSWDEVNQVISEELYNKFVETNTESMSFGGIFWWQTWPKGMLDEFHRNPARTMDWLRWRTETGVWVHKYFADAAKKFDHRTLYGTDLPILNFYKQYFIPYVRAMDLVSINVRYTSGYEISFGVPHECMDSLELAESMAVEQNKPFWGVEVYHQPSWPAESAALQNWGLIAHGMSAPMIFSWYPKSDRGNPRTILEWEERRNRQTSDPFNRACWYMIDADGAHLPAYDAYVRSLREVKRYHEKNDGLSIHRYPTDIAYYISNDSNEYDTMITAATPWGALGQRSCFNLIFLLRLAGITANYVDDATLPDTPGKYNVVIVPYSKVLSQEAAGKLASFAKAGGRVVLAGLSGQIDPWARKYDNLGGPAWADLAWATPDFQEEFFPYTFAANEEPTATAEESSTDNAGTKDEKRGSSVPQDKLFRGVKFGQLAESTPIRDKKGQIVGYSRPWGKGTLIAYGICPDTWVGDPHVSPHLSGWMNQLIYLSGLKYSGRWTLVKADNEDGNSLGTGAPVVDLVVRVKSPTEKFIFALNQGGSGEGVVEVPVEGEGWSAEDVIHPETVVKGDIVDGCWSTRMTLPPLGYRVIRIYRK